MRSKKWILALVFTQFFIIAYLFYKNSEKMQILTETGKTSYVLGLDTAKNIKRQGISIELESFYYGFKDGLKDESKLSIETAQFSRNRALQQARENSSQIYLSNPVSDVKFENQNQKNDLAPKGQMPNNINTMNKKDLNKPSNQNGNKADPKNLSPVQRYLDEQIRKKAHPSTPSK